jgi:hypothetical protein
VTVVVVESGINRLHALEPWHIKESLRTYELSYLVGFEVQRSQVSLEEGFLEAKKTIYNNIYLAVKLDIGGDEQRIGHISTNYQQITLKYIYFVTCLADFLTKIASFR